MRSSKWSAVLMLGLMAGASCAMARAQEATEAQAAQALPADQQATKEQIMKLFDVMRVRQQMETMLKMLPTMAQQTAQQQEKAMLDQLPSGRQLTPEQQEQVSKMTQRIIEKTVASYPMEEVIADATAVYQRHIRREDAAALIAFYSTPAAQHLLDAQPVIAREYMPLVMERMKGMNKTLADEMGKEMKDFLSTLPARN